MCPKASDVYQKVSDVHQKASDGKRRGSETDSMLHIWFIIMDIVENPHEWQLTMITVYHTFQYTAY